LVRTVYQLYWDTNLKGVEQPNESEENVALCTNRKEQGDDKQDKNKGDAFFARMSMNEEHETAMASAKAFSKNGEGVTEAVLANNEVQLFWHRMWSQQQEYEEFLRRREAKFIQEVLGSGEEPEPKRRPRMCAVCGAVGPWNLVCDECKVNPKKLEC